MLTKKRKVDFEVTIYSVSLCMFNISRKQVVSPPVRDQLGSPFLILFYHGFSFSDGRVDRP